MSNGANVYKLTSMHTHPYLCIYIWPLLSVQPIDTTYRNSNSSTLQIYLIALRPAVALYTLNWRIFIYSFKIKNKPTIYVVISTQGGERKIKTKTKQNRREIF